LRLTAVSITDADMWAACKLVYEYNHTPAAGVSKGGFCPLRRRGDSGKGPLGFFTIT
jgi:hypothetical protein